MSWADTIEAGALVCGPSPFDTERFGFPVSRVTVPAGARGVSVADVLAAVERDPAQVVVLRYPARHTTWFASLMAGGHDVLLADTLVYWRLPVGSGRAPERLGNVTATTAVSPDLVDALVADIFAGYGNHYTANPRFDDALVLAGYQEWARRSVKEQGAVVLTDGDEQIGVATIETVSRSTEILLAGVVSRQQGRGWYAHLLAGVERHAAGLGADQVVISTQGHNTGVQRAWARYGFEPVDTMMTVHLMPPSRRPA